VAENAVGYRTNGRAPVTHHQSRAMGSVGSLLSLEEELLSQMRQLQRDLPPVDPYRAAIERHLPKVQEAVGQLRALFRERR
jgi:hypothetical protein